MGDIDRALVARGPLRDKPFCHLILDADRRKASGTLVVVAAASGEVRVRLQDGRANKAWLATPSTDLMQALLPLCALNQGSFSFYHEVDMLTGVADAVCGQVDPFKLLAASLEAHVCDDILDTVLAKYRNAPLRLPPRHNVAWLRMGPRDAVLLDLIRAAPSTPEELIAQTPLPASRTRRLLYAMLITRVLIPFDRASYERTGQITAPPLGPGAEGVSHTSQTLTSLRAQRSAPVAAADSDRMSVAPSPPPSRGPSRVFEQRTTTSLRPCVVSDGASLGARKHSGGVSLRPPSSARPSSAAIPRPSSAAIPRPSSAAIPRASSGRPTTAPAPGPSVPEQDVPARIERVERLARTGRHDEALGELDALLALKPGVARLHGLLALVLFEKHAGAESGLPRIVLQSLERALALDREDTCALYTRALICKRAGDAKRALGYFKRVLELEPENLDAQREVRLATLRGVTGTRDGKP